MFDKEKWGEVFQSIGKNKLRTVLTGFAVFWGIFMLILLLGLGAGLRNGFAYNFRNTAENSISMWGGETSKPWNGLPANRKVQLTEEDVEALRHSIPGLEHISGSYRVWRGNSQLQHGNNYGSYNIRGIVNEHQSLEKQTVARGRFINEVDEEQVRKISRTMALRKVAQPEDVARQVVVLASDALSGHVSGQVVTVAGGMEGRVVHPD